VLPFGEPLKKALFGAEDIALELVNSGHKPLHVHYLFKGVRFELSVTNLT
jgi:hypothetical protein